MSKNLTQQNIIILYSIWYSDLSVLFNVFFIIIIDCLITDAGTGMLFYVTVSYKE